MQADFKCSGSQSEHFTGLPPSGENDNISSQGKVRKLKVGEDLSCLLKSGNLIFFHKNIHKTIDFDTI